MLEFSLIIGVLISLSILCFQFAVRSRDRTDKLLDSVAITSHRSALPEALEMQRPFSDRALRPLLHRILQVAGRLMPQRNLEAVRQQLVGAGLPRGLSVTDFLGLRLIAGLFAGALILLILQGQNRPLIQSILGTIIALVVGTRIPNVWLNRRIRDRHEEILRTLPDALDILSISVSAGLGFDGALQKLTQKWDNVLTREFGKALREIQIGVPRGEALRHIAARNEVSELSNFIAVMVQADQLGLSIAHVLQGQAAQMRQFRRQRAEELAHMAPIKMMFPLVFLIFPALFAVILGPAVPRLAVLFTDVLGGT